MSPEDQPGRRYATALSFRQALEARLNAAAVSSGTDPGRLRRQVAFERLLSRLASSQPSWVLKGGLALELRLGNAGRATKDLDLATLDGETDGDQTWDRLADALADDTSGDHFTFVVDAPRALAADMAGRPGWRFPVDVRLAGKTFVSVRLDVVARADEIEGGVEQLTFPSMIAFAGFEPVLTVPAVGKRNSPDSGRASRSSGRVARRLHGTDRGPGYRSPHGGCRDGRRTGALGCHREGTGLRLGGIAPDPRAGYGRRGCQPSR